tara:strand:- start:260 stop:478 length:219 start_codon:yes stop_codon:yes gene_type:complete
MDNNYDSSNKLESLRKKEAQYESEREKKEEDKMMAPIWKTVTFIFIIAFIIFRFREVIGKYFGDVIANFFGM